MSDDRLTVPIRQALPDPDVDAPACPWSAISDRAATLRQRKSRRVAGQSAAALSAAAVLGLAGVAAAAPGPAHFGLVVLNRLGGWISFQRDGFNYRSLDLPGGPGVVVGQSKDVTLQQAETDARFDLIVPAGVPTGARLLRIEETAPGAGPQLFTFRYETAGGGQFAIAEGPEVLTRPGDCSGECMAQPVSWSEDGTGVTILNTTALTGSQDQSIRTVMLDEG